MKNLVEMLTYDMASDRDQVSGELGVRELPFSLLSPSNASSMPFELQLLRPAVHESNKNILLYQAPVDDFKVSRVEVGATCGSGSCLFCYHPYP